MFSNEILNKNTLIIICVTFLISLKVNGQNYRNPEVNPLKYLPTLTFQEGGFIRTPEKSFPVAYDFNTIQDSNNDGLVNAEDNLENLILFAIGPNIKGVGRTGLTNRGPNNQGPAVYFNYIETYSHNVYQYWYYYGENSHLENHEHDWESIFIYERDTIPVIVQVTSYGKLKNYNWTEFQQDEGHIVLGVRRGDHSFVTKPKNGVAIRWNGEVNSQDGFLRHGHNKLYPWRIFSSIKSLDDCIYFDINETKKFYYGDQSYPRSGAEMDLPRKAPWKRRRWSKPRKKDN